jgi:hypothetical protein
MLHFAYGANMHRGVMRRHAPTAEALGAGHLAGHRFVITADGYASVEPAAGDKVYGMVWRITPRDRVTLDLWENVGGGLYRTAMLPVDFAGRRATALVYLARPRPPGTPRAGYMEVVIAAARELELPEVYLRSLEQWRVDTPAVTGHRRFGDFL